LPSKFCAQVVVGLSCCELQAQLVLRTCLFLAQSEQVRPHLLSITKGSLTGNGLHIASKIADGFYRPRRYAPPEKKPQPLVRRPQPKVGLKYGILILEGGDAASQKIDLRQIACFDSCRVDLNDIGQRFVVLLGESKIFFRQ
jgi:hypothetical protein